MGKKEMKVEGRKNPGKDNLGKITFGILISCSLFREVNEITQSGHKISFFLFLAVLFNLTFTFAVLYYIIMLISWDGKLVMLIIIVTSNANNATAS